MSRIRPHFRQICLSTLLLVACGGGPGAPRPVAAPSARSIVVRTCARAALPPKVRQVSAANKCTCALQDNGALKCWGENLSGQLGLGDTNERGDQPKEMGESLPTIDLGAGRAALSVAAGNGHTCALLDDGAIKCWGSNFYGELGLGDRGDRGDQPKEMGDHLPTIGLGVGRTAVSVTAGAQHTCAILDNGALKCWGRNGVGQLGVGDKNDRGDDANEMGDHLPPVNLGAGRTALSVTAGNDHTCALLHDGALKCWGENQFGQLGLGDKNGRGDQPKQMGDNLPPVNLGAGRTAISVEAGAVHTCAVLDNGAVKCWGYNGDGQLGLGDNHDRGGDHANEMGDHLPAVNLGAGRTALSVSAGGSQTCAILDNGAVKCWGENSAGQLGLGDNTYRGADPNEMGDTLPAVDLGWPVP